MRKSGEWGTGNGEWEDRTWEMKGNPAIDGANPAVAQYARFYAKQEKCGD